MATYKHIRSNVDSKRPTTSLADGQIAINTNIASPGVFFKDSAGTGIVKVGPVHVGTSAPNSTPGAGGSTGNSKGEQWLDTSLTPAQLKVWNGSAWVGVVADELPVSKLQNGSAYQLLQTDSAGTGVEWASNIDVPGSLNVTSTAVFDSTASHPLGSAAAPTITFTGDANTGIYSPGIDQIALSTAGTSRLHVAADGKIGVGTSSPSVKLDVDGDVNIATSGEFRIAGTKVLDATSLGSAVVSSSLTSVGTIGTGVWNGTAIATAYIADSAVTSAKIADGTIINADVNASAAIAGTKISPDFGSQAVTTTGLISADGKVSFPLGTAALPSLYPGSDTNTGIYSPGADQVAISTNGTQRLAIDSSGKVGIGTTSPGAKLEVGGSAAFRTDADVRLTIGSSGSIGSNDSNFIRAATDQVICNAATSSGRHSWEIAGSEAMRIDSSGNVGIGTSSPDTKLDVNGNVQFGDGGGFDMNINGTRHQFSIGGSEKMRIDSSGRVGVGDVAPDVEFSLKGTSDVISRVQATDQSNARLRIQSGNSSSSYLEFGDSDDDDVGEIVYEHSDNHMRFRINGSERMRIDSAGRVGIGNSNPGDYSAVSKDLVVGNHSGARGITIAAQNNNTGYLSWADGTGTIAEQRAGRIAYSHADSSMRFDTAATERMRIDSSGGTYFGITSHQVSTNSGNGGHYIGYPGTFAGFAVANDAVAYFNRIGSDGNVINIRHAGVDEGSISVSGSTVSYNGGHLSRWSQLAAGAARTEILRGSVLSNLDEMCEWGEEDNEQLNRMQVSSVEGDKNVSGVFQSWDDDDDTYVNDFYCAMTGDFVIRIAQGTTVARGDLLMSAGDGTAKSQDDDIIRSKTIAKVTSTNVSETYADGSYCVPCVLMAC